MKRLRRILFDILAIVSTLLLVAATAMWVRSYFVRDVFHNVLEGSGRSVRSWSGRVFIIEVTATRPADSRLVILLRTPSIAGNTRNPDLPPIARGGAYVVHWQGMLTTHTLPRVTLPQASVGNGFGFSRASVSVGGGSRPTISAAVISIPYWPLCVASLVMPIAWALRLRRRQWARQDRCPDCGYDLRATPQRCPECGRVNAPGMRSLPFHLIDRRCTRMTADKSGLALIDRRSSALICG